MFPAAGSSTTNSPSTSPVATPPSWYSGGKIAHFDRVEWHIIPDPATASAALQSGEIDWWELVLADLIPMLKQDKGVHIGLADPAGYMGVMRFNELYPPFDNVKMRQAVLHTDRPEGIHGRRHRQRCERVPGLPLVLPLRHPVRRHALARQDGQARLGARAQAGAGSRLQGREDRADQPDRFRHHPAVRGDHVRQPQEARPQRRPGGNRLGHGGAAARTEGRRRTRAAGASSIPGGPARRS